jgi:osmotically-inducible protein OsmY
MKMKYIFLIGIIYGLLGFFHDAMAQQELNDNEITLAVEIELMNDKQITAHHIDVKTVDGVVTLSGKVNNLLAKDRAAEITQMIKGVRAVVNNLQILPVHLNDRELERDIETALIMDPATDAFELDVSVKNAVVTLTGRVTSWAEKQICTHIVKNVRGVKKVQNNISVQYELERTDPEIKADVEKRLASDVWVDDELVQVKVDNGLVRLSGTVGSAKEKQWATADARVIGVADVDNSALKVEYWVHDELKKDSKVIRKTDQEIGFSIKDALQWDPNVEDENINIIVDQGIVTLTGVVENLKAKNSAESDAENTTGVRRVRNYIKVRPDTEKGDEKIKKDVIEALERDPYTNRYDIHVSVFEGKVYLTGTVDWFFEKARAQEAASSVKGVVEVINNVRSNASWEPIGDKELEQDVNEEFFWNPILDDDKIQVSVDDGVVTLKGTVLEYRQKTEAKEEALDAGAKRVRNNIKIKAWSD